MNHITRRPGRTSLAALLAIPLLVVGLAACAPSADPAPTESKGSSSGAGSSSDGDLDQWRLDFAACMRENGVDMPDPEPGSNGISIGQSSGDVDQSVIQEASEKCIEKLGDAPPMSPEDQAAADKEMLQWAKEAAECYREHGYDVPDPQDSKSITFPSDATQEVIEECGGGQMAKTTDAP